MAGKKTEKFYGVDALIKHVSVLALQLTSVHHNNELNKIAEELYLLDKSLQRLRFQREKMDEDEINHLIDTVRAAE